MAKIPVIKSIYTDGACSGNPGPGGWGTVIYFTNGASHELGGAAPESTNNRMEMQAAIAGLEFLLSAGQSEPITLYTDSEYVKNGITKWIKGWRKKGWKTSTGKPVLNQDLWETLDTLNYQAAQQLGTPVQWLYVRGHSGDVGNERCDEIARAFSLGRRISLKQGVKERQEKGKSVKEKPDELPDNPSKGVNTFAASLKDTSLTLTLDSSQKAGLVDPDPQKVDLESPQSRGTMADLSRDASHDNKVAQLRQVLETLHMADEIAVKGYLISSTELADLMGVSANAVTSRGEYWTWRNWTVSRVQREGNQILWQLERIE